MMFFANRQGSFLLAVCLIGSGWTTAHGQVMVSPAFAESSEEVKAEATRDENTLTLHAIAEPDPALRYRFWPAPEDRESGNPMPFVTRALLLSARAQAQEDYADRYLELYDSSEKLDIEKAKSFLVQFGSTAMKEMERAENLMGIEYDLQLHQLRASEIVATVLPEVQEMRAVARLLDLRARIAMEEQRWDDFCRDVRLNLRLAEVASQSSDFVISRLVGVAIAGMSIGTLEIAIQRPDCPNMYWALASVPWDRVFDIREAIEFETVTAANVLNGGKQLPDMPIGEEAARQQLNELADSIFQLTGSSNSLPQAKFATGVYVVSLADASRDLLRSSKWSQRVEEFSDSEAVLRAISIKFERTRHNWSKWNLLPREQWAEYEFDSDATVSDPHDFFDVAVYSLAPAMNACRTASLRSMQSRNFLLTVEAIRMHAATTGKLPESLEGLKPVPAWLDSISMKPFKYQKHDDRSATIIRAKRHRGDTKTNVKINLVANGGQK